MPENTLSLSLFAYLSLCLNFLAAAGACVAAWAAVANIRRINNPSVSATIIIENHALADCASYRIRITNTGLSPVLINDIVFGFEFLFFKINEKRPDQNSAAKALGYQSFPILIETGQMYEHSALSEGIFSELFASSIGDRKSLASKVYFWARKIHKYKLSTRYFISIHMQNNITHKYRLDAYTKEQLVPRIQEYVLRQKS